MRVKLGLAFSVCDHSRLSAKVAQARPISVIRSFYLDFFTIFNDRIESVFT